MDSLEQFFGKKKSAIVSPRLMRGATFISYEKDGAIIIERGRKNKSVRQVGPFDLAEVQDAERMYRPKRYKNGGRPILVK